MRRWICYLTTHNMEEAEALCSRIAILGRGRVLACGTVEDIRSMCSNRFKGTYQSNGDSRTVYGQTHADLLSKLESLSVEEYTLSRTTLEDLYLELTGREGTKQGG